MQKIPKFTEFRDAGTRIGSEFIAITNGGIISIYSGFYRKYNIKKFTHCLLLIDKAQSLIGLQFGGEELGIGCYKIVPDKDYKTASISTPNFFKLNELNLNDWFGKYAPQEVNDGNRGNLFMIDLESKIAINRKNRIEPV